jgi:hypothetical protein
MLWCDVCYVSIFHRTLCANSVGERESKLNTALNEMSLLLMPWSSAVGSLREPCRAFAFSYINSCNSRADLSMFSWPNADPAAEGGQGV